jgi:hypothetical protein
MTYPLPLEYVDAVRIAATARTKQLCIVEQRVKIWTYPSESHWPAGCKVEQADGELFVFLDENEVEDRR